MPKSEGEQVVLVNEDDREIGTAFKSEVHSADTPLHRGFSAFLFKDNQLLVQQRSSEKVTWPLMWSNSVCGHPGPGESYATAVHRRAQQELSLEILTLTKVADYRYRFERGGVVENEICPIFVGTVATEPTINPAEVEAVKWLSWTDFLEELERDPDSWSEWCREEAVLLENLNLVTR